MFYPLCGLNNFGARGVLVLGVCELMFCTARVCATCGVVVGSNAIGRENTTVSGVASRFSDLVAGITCVFVVA